MLVESRRVRGMLTGFSERYVRAFLDGTDELMNRIVNVEIGDLVDGGVLGEEVR